MMEVLTYLENPHKKMIDTFADIISIFSHTGYFPELSKLMCFKRCQLYKIS